MAGKVDERHTRPALAKKGVTSRDKGVFIPPEDREPTDPQNLKRSKAQFIAHQEAKKRKKEAMAKASKEYDEKDKEKEAPEAGASARLDVELAEQIEGLTKLHPSTEKSLRNKISEILDEEVQKKLSVLLDDKKKSLKDE